MDFFMGQIMPMAITYAPRQTALCQGQLLPVRQNAALFSLLGIAFGGDGKADGTFGLPDLRGRTAQGFGTQGSVMPMGTTGGETDHVLQLNEMPQHVHTVAVAGQGDVGQSPVGMLPGTASMAIYGPAPQSPTPLTGAPLSTVGLGQSHPNMQPSLAMNYVITLAGIYPTRP